MPLLQWSKIKVSFPSIDRRGSRNTIGEGGSVAPLRYAVVIPSKSIDNLEECVKSIRLNEKSTQTIYVVDDDDTGQVEQYCSEVGRVRRIAGVKPFIFARNCNLGIERALEDENEVIILMNDDAQLKTYEGFWNLATLAQSSGYGLIAAACNNVGNRNQFPKGYGLRDEDRMVCFVCVAIPKSTCLKVGLLDERYVNYGMDDDDYCFTVRKAGLKLGVYDGCVVDHKTSVSSYRGDPKTPSDFRENMQRFIDKWGHDNWYLPAEKARQKWAVR